MSEEHFLTLIRQYAQQNRWTDTVRFMKIFISFTKTGPSQYDISSSSRLSKFDTAQQAQGQRKHLCTWPTTNLL
jgi:hypothetical protein